MLYFMPELHELRHDCLDNGLCDIRWGEGGGGMEREVLGTVYNL